MLISLRWATFRLLLRLALWVIPPGPAASLFRLHLLLSREEALQMAESLRHDEEGA